MVYFHFQLKRINLFEDIEDINKEMDMDNMDIKEDTNKVVVMAIKEGVQKIIIKQSILMEFIYFFIINIFIQ